MYTAAKFQSLYSHFDLIYKANSSLEEIELAKLVFSLWKTQIDEKDSWKKSMRVVYIWKKNHAIKRFQILFI
jgi:hypothetical protein